METRVRTSLDWKLAAFVGLVVVLTTAGLGIASYIFARQTLRRQIHDRLSVVVSDRQKLLVAFIQQQQDKALLVASRTRVRQMVEEVQSGQMPVDRFRVESRRYLLDSQRSTEGMRAIWVADPSGRVIAGTDDAHLGEDLSGATEFVEGRRAAQFYLRHDREDRDEALMSAPAFGSSGQLVGVVLLTVDAKPLMEMLADRTGLGRTGVVVLGRRAGENIRYMLVPDAGTQSFELTSAQVPAMAAATAGQVGFQQTRDWRGVEVLAAYRPVGYRDWGLVTKIDVVEAYAPVAWLRRLFLIIGIMVLVLGLSGSYLLARRFTRPILRLAGMAESIAAGNLNARVVVEANDEVGALGAAFNRMTEELSHSHAIMENRVRERTAELATANEALQAQIAERKQAEQARERERELLRIIIDNLPDYICLKDDQSRFLLNNQAHLLVLGAHSQEDTLGKTDFDFFPRDLAEGYFADEQEIIRTGKPLLDYEQPRINKAGHPQWVVASKVPWRDAEGKTVGVLGISRNITERK